PGHFSRSAVRIGPDRRPELFFSGVDPENGPSIIALDGWTGERNWSLSLGAGYRPISVQHFGEDLYVLAIDTVGKGELTLFRIDPARGELKGSGASSLKRAAAMFQATWLEIEPDVALHHSGMYALLLLAP